jgi:hypothetical protein
MFIIFIIISVIIHSHHHHHHPSSPRRRSCWSPSLRMLEVFAVQKNAKM